MSELVAVRPIRTEQDYEAALLEIEVLLEARPGTPDGDQLDILSTLVEAYESEHHAIDAPDPVALIQFVMEQRGLDRNECRQVHRRARSRVRSTIEKGALSLPMIRKLHAGLGLPVSVLLKP